MKLCLTLDREIKIKISKFFGERNGKDRNYTSIFVSERMELDGRVRNT